MFETIFSDGTMTTTQFLIVMGVSLVAGIAFAFMTYFKSNSTKSFYITTALMPLAVSVVIALVNGNIGAGVAVAGAFSLIRFRSAPGTAKEIITIFISMAAGIAFGMGYVGYGLVVLLVTGLVLMALNYFNFWDKDNKANHLKLKITIPEDLNYMEVFSDLMEEYTLKHELIKVKTTNMGSMFRLNYDIIINDLNKEKELIDAIRCRNGNLEVSMVRADIEDVEL